MRIISGKFRSRVIDAVKGDSTRPTLDKTKESIFNIIGPYFEGGLCLDLFAGSGNLGIEALSRGMDKCIFVDSNFNAYTAIQNNLNKLKITNCEVKKIDYKKALLQYSNSKFDLVLLDPPYLKQRIDEILNHLSSNNMINEYGYVVCETLKEDSFNDSYGELEKIKDVVYGITRISIYQMIRKNKEEVDK